MKGWKSLSIAGKLYLVVGVMAVLIACELLTLGFAMRTLSAVRAFVEGEGSWSKAQKNAALSLQLYGATREEKDYQAFLDDLMIPEGDHLARIELLKPHPTMEVIRRGFLQGKVHPDDIEPMVDLLRRFSRVSFLKSAILNWTEGDRLLEEFKKAGAAYHDQPRNKETFRRIQNLNEEMTAIEQGFSESLGEGSRWLEHIVLSLLFLAVLMVESVGLTLTFLTSRRISRGLADLNRAATRIGQGDFSHPLEAFSTDEIGVLNDSINRMGGMLEVSQKELEVRVQERTIELARMVDENARLYREAKDALEIRDEFLSIASHELRTPLTALSLHVQLLERTLPTQEASESILKLNRHVRRLTGLIDQLLDLTRIRSGKFQLRLQTCDLTAIVREAVSEQVVEALRRGSQVLVQSKTTTLAECDPERIRQVITNLLSNAIKYGEGKPIAVTIEGSAEGVEVCVRDQGPGIALDQQERIFERFERAADQSEVSGLGLGLYISKEIMAAHGGTISVQSSVGSGAEFRVRLKAAPLRG